VRRALLWLPIVALAVTAPAAAGTPGPVLHEPIPADPREDLAMHVALDGDLPAAIQTPSGLVSAPDPRAPTSPADAAYGASADRSTFQPDRDTKRPEVTGYDEPFTPSTAPFKRLEAYDAVREDYQLYVRDPRLVALPASTPPGADDEAFYADLVVDVAPGRNVRIPTVGPGARMVRGRLGVGADDVAFKVLRDGAENWYLQATGARGPVRARLVMELAIARAAFGGQMGDPSWNELLFVPPLPESVAREAAEVRAAVGVSRAQRPREAIARMVTYFRGFADSDDPPRGKGSVYLDLALSKKGVCRHRAFAFLVTAQSLGVPTRLVLNEAHAWVEVHDGALWRRLDLGGAGHMVNPASNALPERAVYRPPPDVFAWPQNAERGDDMVADARARAAAANGGGGGGMGPASSASGGPAQEPAPASPSAAGDAGAGMGATGSAAAEHDDRPPSVLTLTVADADAHRGLPLRVRGTVRADGEPCAHVAVELWLREATPHGQGASATARQLVLGTLATRDDGSFDGGIVVPGTTPLGDYDVVARTRGDGRCGSGASF
jgi:transglutaminase-like putative cysteine protease